jgi:hypothetical protein
MSALRVNSGTGRAAFIPQKVSQAASIALKEDFSGTIKRKVHLLFVQTTRTKKS